MSLFDCFFRNQNTIHTYLNVLSRLQKKKKAGMTYFMASKIRVRRDDDPLRCDDAFCLFFLESSLLMSKT